MQLFKHPAAAAGFHDEGLVFVADEKAVVVIELAVKAAVSALAVGLDKVFYDVHRFLCRFRAFQSEPYYIHADKPLGFFVGTFGEKRFVSDGNAPFVDSHFRAPRPAGFDEKNGVNVFRLRN